MQKALAVVAQRPDLILRLFGGETARRGLAVLILAPGGFTWTLNDVVCLVQHFTFCSFFRFFSSFFV